MAIVQPPWRWQTTSPTRHVAAEAWRLLSEINANCNAGMRRCPTSKSHCSRHRTHVPFACVGRCCSNSAATTPARSPNCEALAREAADSPQLLVHLGRATRARGTQRGGRAENRSRHCNAGRPTRACIAGSRELRWLRGAGEELMAPLLQAIERYPAEMPLRLVAADLLRSAGRPDKALKLLEQGLARAPGRAPSSHRSACCSTTSIGRRKRSGICKPP